MWMFCFIWICLLQESIILFCILGDKHIKYIIVWPAYTSLGHGQNFVQKDWVNGLSSHAPDEERIGSTIIIFVIKINVVLLKRKRWTQCDDCKEDFRGEEWLGEHVVLFMKRDLLKCDVCGKHFRRRST